MRLKETDSRGKAEHMKQPSNFSGGCGYGGHGHREGFGVEARAGKNTPEAEEHVSLVGSPERKDILKLFSWGMVLEVHESVPVPKMTQREPEFCAKHSARHYKECTPD